jgi:hypothetical protein
LHPVK